jgi:hypothetical protein
LKRLAHGLRRQCSRPRGHLLTISATSRRVAPIWGTTPEELLHRGGVLAPPRQNRCHNAKRPEGVGLQEKRVPPQEGPLSIRRRHQRSGSTRASFARNRALRGGGAANRARGSGSAGTVGFSSSSGARAARSCVGRLLPAARAGAAGVPVDARSPRHITGRVLWETRSRGPPRMAPAFRRSAHEWFR